MPPSAASTTTRPFTVCGWPLIRNDSVSALLARAAELVAGLPFSLRRFSAATAPSAPAVSNARNSTMAARFAVIRRHELCERKLASPSPVGGARRHTSIVTRRLTPLQIRIRLIPRGMMNIEHNHAALLAENEPAPRTDEYWKLIPFLRSFLRSKEAIAQLADSQAIVSASNVLREVRLLDDRLFDRATSTGRPGRLGCWKPRQS